MQSHVQKWGNSLGIRIPAQFSKQLSLKKGSAIKIDIEGDHLVIRPHAYDLQEMVDAITDENKYEAISDYTPVGKEIWEW